MNAAGAAAHATLALLRERIGSRGDMHGFAKAIGAVLGAVRGEQEQAFSMTGTVLSDPVLTQKVLRLANSGMYAAFGQRINTVTKAVLVLGTDAIGQLALGLKAIEDLNGADADAQRAHIEMEKAVLAGMVARQVALRASAAPDPELAAVCSMLHMLGRMLVSFYLPELWRALQEHAGAGCEDDAAVPVLGLSMEDIGRAAAVQWGLPHELVGSMRRVEPGPGAAHGHADWLAALSSMSACCADLLWHDDEAGAVTLRALAASFSALLGVAPDAILAAVATARETGATDLALAPLALPRARRPRAHAAARTRAEANPVLRAGVAEMAGALAGAAPGQMLSVALDTVYRGLACTRAVAFVRNRRERNYCAKLGLGDGVAERLAQMAFDEMYQPNVFHAALGSDRVILIDNPRERSFAAKLPHWWTASLGSARSFVLLPVCCNGRPAGLIYADWDDSFDAIMLSQAEFALLNELRALLAGSFEQRHKLEPASR